MAVCGAVAQIRALAEPNRRRSAFRLIARHASPSPANSPPRAAPRSSRRALVSVAVGAPLAGRECVNDFPRRALCKFVDDLRDAIPEQIDASTGAPIRIGAYQIRQASPPLRPLLPIPAPAFIYSRPLTCIRSANPPKLHRDLPPTKLYAYGRSAATAHYPGPTLVAKRGVPSQVYWENHLTDRHHMFPVDYSIDDVARPLLGGIPIGEPRCFPNRLIHSHAHTSLTLSIPLPIMLPNLFTCPCSHHALLPLALLLRSDAQARRGESIIRGRHPEAWFMQYSEVGRAFRMRLYRYPNHQLPTTLWYHDHAVGLTHLNVAAGLADFFLLTDLLGVERALAWLPRGEFEVPLALADRRFFPNGSIDCPRQGMVPRVHAHWVPEYIGDTILVTGKVWPYLSVKRALYRFRVLGVANARFFNLRFVCATSRNYTNFTPPFTGDQLPITVVRLHNSFSFNCTTPHPSTNPCTSPTPSLGAPPLRQIGSDGGYLPRPAVRTALVVAPAERYDILVDFSNLRSSCADVILTNDAPAPFPGADLAVPPMDLSQVVLERWITAVEESDRATGNPIRLTFDHKMYSHPPTETPRVNSDELWHVINLTPDAHPIHLHLIQHRPASRRPFDLAAYNSGACSFTNALLPSCFSAAQQPVVVYERGWKDTTILPPGHVLTLWTPWYSQDGTPFPFDATRGPGYVWHCHIVEHEENMMMRPLIVTQ
ncbi:unnamed protein product [Closterium sp. NIES-64]|nr:unnamed protein product [Closterium sp. NIES-64]